MSDELRARIAATLDRNFNTGGYLAKIKSAMFRDYALVIIDDLGLTVEERIDEPGKRGINPVKRVVGRWEKQ